VIELESTLHTVKAIVTWPGYWFTAAANLFESSYYQRRCIFSLTPYIIIDEYFDPQPIALVSLTELTEIVYYQQANITCFEANLALNPVTSPTVEVTFTLGELDLSLQVSGADAWLLQQSVTQFQQQYHGVGGLAQGNYPGAIRFAGDVQSYLHLFLREEGLRKRRHRLAALARK